MPCNDSTMACGFTEELIVKESEAFSQQLIGGYKESRVPEDIMEGGANTPCSQGMKQSGVRVFGFIAVVFIKEFTSLMAGISHFHKVGTQDIHLARGEELYPIKVTMVPEMEDLRFGQAVLQPFFRVLRGREKLRNQPRIEAQVVCHSVLIDGGCPILIKCGRSLKAIVCWVKNLVVIE